MASLRGRLLSKRSHASGSNNSNSSNNSHRMTALIDEDSSGGRIFEKSDGDDDDDDVSSISCEPFEHQRLAAVGSQTIPDLMIMTDRSDNRSSTNTETSDLANNNNNDGSGKNRYESTPSNNKSELNKLSTSQGFASANRSKHKKRLELAHKMAATKGNRADVKGNNVRSSSRQTFGGNDFNKASLMLGPTCDIASIKLPVTNSQKETIFRLYNLEMEKLDKELHRLDEEEMELKAKNATLLRHYDELRKKYIKHMGVDSLPVETELQSPEVGLNQPLKQEMTGW